jgi:hypothetical protein
VVGGVLLAIWLVVGEHAGNPAMQRLAWCSAGGLVAGGVSLLMCAGKPLAIVGGIAALLAIPSVWPLANGFWATSAVVVLALVCINLARRVFDLRKLERHYRQALRAEDAETPTRRTARWEAVTVIAMCLSMPLMVWIMNGLPLPGRTKPPEAEVEAAPAIRRISTSGADRISLAVFHGQMLPTGRTWHVRTRIRWEGVQGQAMIESWQRFADGGAYFTRTLADSGPMAPFTGTSTAWRDVVLPFDAGASAAALTGIEATLVMAGPGTVEVEPVTVAEGLPR